MPTSRSMEEKVELVKKWSSWFYNHTDSFDGKLGMQLAYLWPAILNDNVVECSERDPLPKLLRENGVTEDDILWEYIHDIPAMDEEGKPLCPHEADTSEMEVAFSPIDGTWLVDVVCTKCGKNGHHYVREDTVEWGYP